MPTAIRFYAYHTGQSVGHILEMERTSFFDVAFLQRFEREEMPMITTKQLEDMSNQNIETINKNTLVDVTTIHINQDLPPEQKLLSFIEQIKNPYCFQYECTTIRLCFADDGPELGAVLENFFISLKQS